MDSPSAIALVLTLLLALCSALAFVLIYLRSPWIRVVGSGAGMHAVGSHLNLNGASSTIQPNTGGGSATHATHNHNNHNGNGNGNSNGNNQGTIRNAHHHHHHHHNGTSLSGSMNAANKQPAQLDPIQGTLAHALGGSSLLHPLGGGTAAPPPASLAGGDLSLRGRKAKKRGGRVHVTATPASQPSGGGGGRSRATSSAAQHTHTPYVYPLEFLSAAPPVIVCLTTIPSRVHHIDKCLNSIKTQNYPIAQMILAIPEDCRREHTKYSIPDRVRKDAIISVVRVPHDYGPSTALITAWSAIPDSLQHSDTLIITLDDDQIYHPDTVATLVRHALQYPDAAIGFAGYTLRGPPYIQPNLAYCRPRDERPELAWRHTQQSLQQQLAYAAAQAQASTGAPSAALAHAASHIDPALLPPFDPLPDSPPDADPYHSPMPNPNDVYETQQVDVLCGWRGICIRKKQLDEQLWKEYDEIQSEAAYWANDEWISAQLAKNGVSRRVILAPFDSVLSRLRLRHGRNSSTASHLAHQQTILEYVTRHPTRSNVFGRDSSYLRRVDSSAAADELICSPPTSADLIRLRQLIRPYKPEEEEEEEQQTSEDEKEQHQRTEEEHHTTTTTTTTDETATAAAAAPGSSPSST